MMNLEDVVAEAQVEMVDTCRASNGLPLLTAEERTSLLADLRDSAITAAIAAVERQQMDRLARLMDTVAVPTGDSAGTFIAVRRSRKAR